MWNDLALALAKFTCNKKRKLGFFFQENIYNGIRIMPLYRCFQRANLDTPHDQRKFRMQFWHMRIDSHAVSHFTELCLHLLQIGHGFWISTTKVKGRVYLELCQLLLFRFWAKNGRWAAEASSANQGGWRVGIFDLHHTTGRQIDCKARGRAWTLCSCLFWCDFILACDCPCFRRRSPPP